MSFCTVPPRRVHGVPRRRATTRIIPSKIAAGALIVIEIVTRSRGIPSSSSSMSGTASIATPTFPTSPRARGESESRPSWGGRSKATERPRWQSRHIGASSKAARGTSRDESPWYMGILRDRTDRSPLCGKTVRAGSRSGWPPERAVDPPTWSRRRSYGDGSLQEGTIPRPETTSSMSGHEPTLSQRLRYHVENSPLAVIEWDERLCVQYWSKQAERIFGYPAYEVLGRDAQSLGIVFHDDADDSARVTERL